MFQLKLFGVPAVERDGVLVTGRASHRHRLALLALLALAPGRRLSRDKLIAYLWPESDPDRGRNLLKVATYVLRSALTEDALLSTGDELRLNTDLIQVDVAEFEDAVERSAHDLAVSRYAGPLLDGFFLTEAPEFEHWVDRERDRLAGAYRNALEALAEAAFEAGDLARSVDWWKVRAGQDPYDSRVALRLMQALEASGNRAGALQHAAIHSRLIQEEYGLEAAPEVAALAERLRRESPVSAPPLQPKLVAMQEVIAHGTVALAAPTVVPAVAIASSTPRRRRWAISLASVVFVLSFAGMFSMWPRERDPAQSIVVLPFINLSSDPDNEYFSDGLTEEIIARLAAVPGLKVISRTSAMRYKQSKLALPEIAAELKVDHILEGSVRQSDGRVRITAQLIDASADGHLWAENYEHTLEDNFRVQEEIAQKVARALELRLAPQTRKMLARQTTRDPEAYDLYQRGRFLWNLRTREGHARAIDYFNRAIARDSAYADAFAGLAQVYLTGYQLNLIDASEAELYDRVKWASERALALDDKSADAHAVFAISLKWQRNWTGAERELQRAIELNPGNATARSWYGLLLRGMGRPEEALRESRLSAELDPFGVVIAHNYGYQCYHMRDYACALEQFRRTLGITEYPGAHRGLGLTYSHMGDHPRAVASARRAVELAPERPDFVADLAYVLARAGQTQEARATLDRAKLQPREGFSIARAYVALGERDSAFVWFDRSNWRWSHRAARIDPALDPIRSDPRFTELVVRVDRQMGMR